MSTLEITRHRGWTDKIRKWKVFIDGYELGRIRQGESLSWAIEPGEHELWLKVDWASSQSISFSIKPEETARFECRARGLPLALWRFNWNAWIDLYEMES
jgi:hypothetical protein